MKSTVGTSRMLSCMVLVEGPDPHYAAIANYPFYHHHRGTSQLSCSAMRTSDDTVICPMDVMEVFWDRKTGRMREGSVVRVVLSDELDAEPVRATVEGVVDVPVASVGVQVLNRLHPSVQVGWKVTRTPKQLDGLNHLELVDWKQSNGDVGEPSVSAPGDHVGFAVLKIDTRAQNARDQCPRRAVVQTRVLEIGAPVYTIGSPFGNVCLTALFNSICRGSVVNYWSEKSSAEQGHPPLFLVDCRCCPGMEGAPVFVDGSDSGHPCVAGILLRPLHHADSGAEFHLCVSASVILDRVRQSFGHSSCSWLCSETDDQSQGAVPKQPSVRHLLPSVAQNLSSCTCLITAGTLWGTGTMVSKHGFILTCAHVVRASVADDQKDVDLYPRLKAPIAVTYKGVCLPASLLFISRNAYDIALLSITDSPAGLHFDDVRAVAPPLPLLCHRLNISHVSMSSALDSALAIVQGHPMMGPTTLLPPSVTVGSFSKAIPHVEEFRGLFAIQTDAAVHVGNSGGPLFALISLPLPQLPADHSPTPTSLPFLSWVGIVAQHGKRSDGSTIPRLNFSLAVDPLLPLLRALDDHSDTGSLSESLLTEALRPIRDPSGTAGNDDIFALHVLRLSQSPVTKVLDHPLLPPIRHRSKL